MIRTFPSHRRVSENSFEPHLLPLEAWQQSPRIPRFGVFLSVNGKCLDSLRLTKLDKTKK